LSCENAFVSVLINSTSTSANGRDWQGLKSKKLRSTAVKAGSAPRISNFWKTTAAAHMEVQLPVWNYETAF